MSFLVREGGRVLGRPGPSTFPRPLSPRGQSGRRTLYRLCPPYESPGAGCDLFLARVSSSTGPQGGAMAMLGWGELDAEEGGVMVVVGAPRAGRTALLDVIADRTRRRAWPFYDDSRMPRPR